MNGLSGADGGQVAVALIGEHDVVFRIRALEAGGDGGSAAVGGLHHVAGKVVIGHDRAADGRYADGAAFDAQLVNDFGHQTMHDAVGAAGAVMEGNIQKGLGLFKNDHYFSPPFFAASAILANTSSGEGMMPPARLQRLTGRLHSMARRTSSIIWPMDSSTEMKEWHC